MQKDTDGNLTLCKSTQEERGGEACGMTVDPVYEERKGHKRYSSCLIDRRAMPQDDALQVNEVLHKCMTYNY